MGKIGLFYGTDTGNTEDAARRIKDMLDAIEPGLADIHDMARATPADFAGYAYFILGIPTANIGQLQTDWDVFWPQLDEIDFNGRKAALFGLGDQYTYGNTFMDALGMLALKLQERGCTLVGSWPAADYNFDGSLALDGDRFYGLALDQENQPDKTEERLNAWVPQVLAEFGIAVPAAA